MRLPRLRLSSLTVATTLLLAAHSTSATVLLTDTMSRASRTAAPTPSGAQWFSIGPSVAVTYAPNNLRATHPGGGGGQLLGYLTAAGSPVSLAVGEELKATFTFSLVGGFGTASGATDFRVGLFNTGGGRISTDVTTLSSSGTFTPYTGYAAMMSPRTTNGISIRRRVPNAGTNQTNLIGTATNVYTAALASGSSQILQSNVDYAGVLTATRTATGTEFRVSLSGGGLTGYQLSYTDTDTTRVQTFDAIAFGWQSGLMLADGGLVIRALTIERDSAATLNPTDPLANPDPGRPFIWVREAEKPGILAKIDANAWAQTVRNGMIARVAANVASHQADRDAFLRQLPVNWSDPIPKFKTMLNTSPFSEVRGPAVAKFNAGLDCAVLYYLTGETKYAQCAADILHNVVQTLLPVTPSAALSNGGWIVQNDLLLEARILGTHLPIIYDFIRAFLETNKVWDVATGALADFDYLKTQTVFRTYYQLTRDHGSANNNWSALMATCMLNNLLALADPNERKAALKVYLETGSSRQASLDDDYRHYAEAGNIWPESLQYASDVVSIRSTHLVLLERYDPTLTLLSQYPNYPLSLSRISYLRYPNGEQISFGDGPRQTGGEPYFDYEVIYQHAKARGRQDLVEHFGAAIKRGIDAGRHNRAALVPYEALGMHHEPVQLLWFAADITEAGVPQVLPTTDRLPFAGIALQRNLSPEGKLYGLMGFVGGAGHTHSHASGMSMELYGAGQVLGAKSGKSTYQSTLHENYYRLFASNNTIIVNGASRGEGGWEGTGINTVGTAAMEPAVAQAPVSPNHSFTTSTFSDTRGTLAEATQQRTLGIIRTSPTTGYYVDIFRSDSSLASEYHDYIYRNVGDSVSLETENGPLALTSAPSRFASDIGDTYKQPGWRYFTHTEVSAATDAGVQVNFSANLPAGPTQMRMHMPGSSGREYARVSSPPIVDAPAPYDTRNAPAVVIRKYGSAQNQPFAAVFEPHLGSPGSGTVKTVSTLEKNGVVVGLQVGSTVAGRNLVQYVLSNPNASDLFEDAARGLSFKGRYAVVTDHGDGSGSLYLGEGSSLSFKGNSVASGSGANTQAYVEFTAGQSPVVKSNQPVIVQTPPTITVPATASGTFGASLSLTVTTTGQPTPTLAVTSALPPGLNFNPATGIFSGTPAAAGNFTVEFEATNAAGSATGMLAPSIAKAAATIALQNLEQTYTGQPLSPTAITGPANLPVLLDFAGGSAPVDAGSYPVTATIVSPNYEGSTDATFVIRKAQATVALSNLDQPYTGTPRPVTASTTPPNLIVTLTYGGNPDAPTYPGDYAVVASVVDRNFEGSTATTLRVSTTALVRELPQLLGGIDGSVHLLAGRDVQLAGNAWIAGDLLVPGSPAIILQGSPVYGTTRQGPGAAEPSAYAIALLGNAALRAVVLRIDPLALVAPPAPSAPRGTIDLVLTKPQQTVGDFSTLRDLTLAGNASDIQVPPGTYGKLSAAGRASFILGVAGATSPSVYEVQSLELAGDSRLVLSGPVVLRVDQKVEFQSNAGSPAHPELLRLELHRGEVILDRRSVVGGLILAPDARVILRGQSELHGRVVAGELEIHARAALVDPRLP